MATSRVSQAGCHAVADALAANAATRAPFISFDLSDNR
jgi:hypothetical protein